MSALDVGSGLARGLATVLMGHRQDQERKALDAEHQANALKLAAFQDAIGKGQAYDAAASAFGLQDILSGGAKPKKGEPDFNALHQAILAPALDSQKVDAEAGSTDPISLQRQPAPTSKLLTSDELATQKASQVANALVTKQTLLGKAALAYLPEMQKMDPTATLKDAIEFITEKNLFSTPGSSGGFQSIPGEMPNGAPAFGVFDRPSGRYLDPNTHEPLIGFQPRTTTGSVRLGADREAISKELYGLPASRLNSEQMAEVNKRMAPFAEQQANARGIGAGKAKIQTELNSPIGPTAAQQYNVAPTTTLKELSNVVGLTDSEQQSIRTFAQLDLLVNDITDGIEKVFPDVSPGVKGRLQTQFDLGMKKFAADEDLASLDGAIQGALAQVVVLQGQSGGRISDRDVELAKSTLAQLTPSVFGGDTKQTARARLTILRNLFEKAKGNITVPRPQAQPSQVKPSGGDAAVEGAVIRDGHLYIKGQLIQ